MVASCFNMVARRFIIDLYGSQPYCIIISLNEFEICKYLVLYRYMKIASIYLNLLICKTAGYLATLINL